MRTWRIVPATLLLASVALATTAWSQPGIWLGASTGFNTYAMSDVNKDINDFSAFTGYSMDEISHGLAFGLQAGVNATPTVSVSAGYERLTGSSKVGDSTGSLEYDFPANVFYGGLQYTFPSGMPLHIGLEGLAGIVSTAGSIKLSVAGVGAASGDVSGSGVALEGRIVGDYQAAPRLFISPSIGYSYAKINEFKIENETVVGSDGSKMSLDYGGLRLRLGLKYML